jgi:hypothetical protein
VANIPGIHQLTLKSILEYALAACSAAASHIVPESFTSTARNEVVNALLDVWLDSTFSFLKTDYILPVLDILVPSKLELSCLLDIYRLHGISELARQQDIIHQVPEVIWLSVIDLLSSIFSSNVSHFVAFFIGDSSLQFKHPRGDITTLLVNIMCHKRNLKISEKLLTLFRSLLLFKQNGVCIFRSHIISTLSSMDKSLLALWLKQNLLGFTDCEVTNVAGVPASEAVKLLSIRFVNIVIFGSDIPPLKITSPSAVDGDMGVFVFDILVSILPDAFADWFHWFKEYFYLLQVLAYHTHSLPKLVYALSNLLKKSVVHNFSKAGALANVEARLEALCVLLQLFETLLKRCNSVLLSHGAEPSAMDIDILTPKKKDKALAGDMVNEDISVEESIDDTCCTYTTTSNNYLEQHWYYCYTCKLTFTEGCCSICVRVCHKDHDVSYSRFSRFFCDCGAGARGLVCKALKPRHSTHKKEIPLLTPSVSLRKPHHKQVLTGQEDIADNESSILIPSVPPETAALLLATIVEEGLLDITLDLYSYLYTLLKNGQHASILPKVVTTKIDLFSTSKEISYTKIESGTLFAKLYSWVAIIIKIKKKLLLLEFAKRSGN